MDPYQPPIVPGAPQPPPPAQYPQSAPPAGYYPPPQPAQPQQAWNPGRAAGNTVVVLVTLFIVLCGLPVILCAGISFMGSMSNH